MDDLQAAEGVFTPTRTILSSAPMFGIPEVLLDEAHGLWSIRQPGMEQASVFRCADIASCEVEEIEAEVTPAPRACVAWAKFSLTPWVSHAAMRLAAKIVSTASTLWCR